MKAEAEKRGLGSCVELKFCRLEKGKDGSKAFAINTQEQWDEERPLLSGNTSSLQGRNPGGGLPYETDGDARRLP